MLEKLLKALTVKYLNLVMKRNENFLNNITKRANNVENKILENDKVESEIAQKDRDVINNCIQILNNTNYYKDGKVMRRYKIQ